jgi:carbonic anhydrase
MLPRIAFLASILSNAAPTLASCAHGTSLLRRTEEPIGKPEFGYGTINGPINWHGISEDNLECVVGKNQSPINIGDSITISPAGFVDMEIPPQDKVEFENLGTNVQVIINGSTTIDNEVYTLEQFHFHTPSEHRINNEHFPVEVHMVHEARG